MLKGRDAIEGKPGDRGSVVIPLTDKDRANIARAYAEGYVAAVEDFLRKHPGAKPLNGLRATDIIRSPTAADIAREPVCENWGFGIVERMGNMDLKEIELESGQVIRFGWIITVEPGQHDGIAWTTVGQHNFCVIFPKGYEIDDPHTDDVLRILDPWWDLMPRVFVTDTYNILIIRDVDRVGRDELKISPGEPWIRRLGKWFWRTFWEERLPPMNFFPPRLW